MSLSVVGGSNSQEVERPNLFAQTTVYINAGGRGTRLESVVPKGPSGVTKALLQFDGKPLIGHHTDLLEQLGFRRVIVGAGDHLNVKRYYEGKENPKLQVVNTEIQEDTGGDLIKAVKTASDLGKSVLVENVDTFLYVKDLAEFLAQHERSGAIATIVLTTKKGVPNEGAFFVDENGRVVFSQEAGEEYGLSKPQGWSGFRGSSTGVIIFNTDFLQSHWWQSGQKPLSIYRDLVPELIKSGGLYAYNNGNRLFVDIGTPEQYERVRRHQRKLLKALGGEYLEQNN